jgi:hypothetical protein
MIIIYNQQGYFCGGERRTVTDDFAPSAVLPRRSAYDGVVQAACSEVYSPANLSAVLIGNCPTASPSHFRPVV